MNLCVIIPAYNESRTIETLVRKVVVMGHDCLVVDDGSTDDTASLAQGAGAEVIRGGENKGKGYALRLGFDHCCQREYDAVIILDGDGQHDPKEIKGFIACAESTGAGMVVGNRMNDVKHMPFIRRVTNRLMSFLLSRRARQVVPDTQCGYRLLTRDFLTQMQLATGHFEIESEMILEATRLNHHIASVPICTIYQDEHSKIKPVRDTVRFVRLLLRRR